jgi:hypothetical protein
MQNMSALARRWNTSLATHHTATVLQSLQNNSYRQHIERTVSGPAIIGLEEFGPSRLKGALVHMCQLLRARAPTYSLENSIQVSV